MTHELIHTAPFRAAWAPLLPPHPLGPASHPIARASVPERPDFRSLAGLGLGESEDVDGRWWTMVMELIWWVWIRTNHRILKTIRTWNRENIRIDQCCFLLV